MAFNQQINSIAPNKDVNPLFLYGLIKASKAKIQNSTTTGMKRIVTKSKFEEIPLFLPPIELQNTFAEISDNIERQKTKAEGSLQKSEALFNALLQRAFRGELFAEGMESEETAAGPVTAGAAQLDLF